MAGDHKCPVCQATFTRPQHVARHMRSHTGDRPYKCQHCGDQFARSDLLSRHVNKCHAGDKPPTTTAPTRRKGQHGASSTRATTSKQACDQCVIATLPCDGANPCSKCVQHKCPCTYVKFQRQTAPSGPGHKNSHSLDSTSSVSNLSSAMPRADDLFLGPPPMTVPSMVPVGELFYPSAHPQFAFNAPPGPHNWDSDSPNPPSLTLSTTTDSGPDGSSTDVASHFCNPDPTLVPPGYPAPATAESGLIPNSHAYYAHQHHPPPGATSVSWQMPADYHMQRKIEDGFAQYLPPGPSTQIGSPSSLIHPANLDYHHNGGLYSLHARRGSIDGFSDGSGASAPNSAASSSVHLPLDFGASEQEHQQQQQQQQLNDIMSYAQYTDGHPPPSRDGRIASSFGSLSINDAGAPFNYNNNVHGPEGNAPFFTQHAMKLPPQDSTPRPFRTDEDPSQLQSPRDREAEMRELRDFWKQYLRTPLTGPMLGQTPKAELINNQLGALGDATRPTPKRGLSRVASLPSVRTPPDEKLSAAMARANNAQIPSVQTTDDLKKYEEAVLARKPLNLTFIPRKGRLSVPSSVSPQPNPEQQMLHQNLASQLFMESGSPANFSHSNDNSGDDNPPMSAGGCRPSFKRLPSQTLENTVQKRALFRWGGEDPLDDTDSETDGPGAMAHAGAGGYHHPHNSVPMGAEHYRTMQFAHTESLLDRYRRQSAPTAVRPNLDPGGVPHEHSPSPGGYAGGAMHAGHMAGDVGMSTSPQPPGQPGGALVQS